MARRRARLPKGCYWRGDTIWHRVSVGGVEHRQSLRTGDVEIAQREAERIRARLTAATFGGEHRRTFDEAFSAWAEHIADQVAASTARRYAVSFGQMVPVLRPLMVDEIDERVVAQILRMRKAAGAAQATIRRDLTALSSLLEYATDEGWRRGNPALEKMRRLKERRDPISLPHDADIARVVARAPGAFSALIRFALATGCRQEEVAGLHWRQVRGDQMTLVGKGRKRRTMTLSAEALAALAAVPQRLHCPIVFWHDDHDGQAQRYRNVASRFSGFVTDAARSAAAEGAEFRRFRFHDLRHRFAVDRLREGWSLYEVQRALGHASVKTTEIYLAHLTADEERSARGPAQAYGLGDFGTTLKR
jgi:integrase/recombinase XerD